VGGDQLQPGVEDGGTPTEVVAEKNKKILKTRKQENTPKRMAGEHWGGVSSPRVGGGQLQPGVEDGGTPTEVVAEENKKILKTRKQEN
jgi:hypothetical protein